MYVTASLNGVTKFTRYVPSHGFHSGLVNSFTHNSITYTITTSFTNAPYHQEDYDNSSFAPSIVEYTLRMSVVAPYNCAVKSGYSGELLSYRNVTRSLVAGVVGWLPGHSWGGYSGDTHSSTSSYSFPYISFGQYTPTP